MKTVFVFTCVVAAVLAGSLPESERIFLKEVHDSCQANPTTYCDEDKLRNLSNNVNDHQVGVHMSCMAIKSGLQQTNGDLIIPTIRTKLGLVTDKSKVDGYVRTCAKQAENPGKTANLLFICFVKNGLEYYHKL